MSDQTKVFENLLSMQAAEIRKFVLEQIKDLVTIHKLNPVELEKTIKDITALVQSNEGNVKSIIDLVNGNKNAIERATQELKDLIVKSDESTLKLIRQEYIEALTKSNKDLNDRIDAMQKDLSFRTSINPHLLINAFSKTLWNYTDYICTKDSVFGSGFNSVKLQLSGDHFNALAVSDDVGLGSPTAVIFINGKEVHKQKIFAVKMLNQYEYLTIRTSENITEISVRMEVDAWEGGSDRNSDGMSEDRNLRIFELYINDRKIEQKDLKSGKLPAALWSTGQPTDSVYRF